MGETFETYKECSEYVDKVKGVNLSTLKLHGSAATETFNAEVDKMLAQAGALKAEGFNWDKAPVICELNGYRWHLGPESPEPMAWDGAIEWCKSVGGELPPREILCMASLTFDWFGERPYWSSTEFYATYAWVKHFRCGDEFYATKAYQTYVRAVRAIAYSGST
jgi:hypothetical protein